MAYFYQEKHQEACNAFTQAISINPDNVKAHLHLGITYFSLGDKDAAHREYEILKALDEELAKELLKKIEK
jgi:Tfp pilus assembly protein PilF